MSVNYPEYPGSLILLEEQMLDRWRREQLFERQVEWSRGGEPWVFFEGPPTANGRPGLHHIIARTIKDLYCRHRTLKGHWVTRIAGWDTHGLPVEIEAEKTLGISGKPEIEAYGIARFNEVCRQSVFTYKEEWEKLSERIGYWLDYSRAYVTYHTSYIESVWWVLSQLAERDLLYRGHKSVPYCTRCGTALSSHEVAQGYEDVDDPSLYFSAPVLDLSGNPDGRSFLVWTTTPWTVPSNAALAVHPDLVYVEVEHEGTRWIVAEARMEALFGEDVQPTVRCAGRDLVGLSYARPLDIVPLPEDPGNAWTVVAESFVTADDGTGVVHIAPAFGADDYAAGQTHGLPLLKPIDDQGRFLDHVDRVAGMHVKEADPVLIELLRGRGGLWRVERYRHSYPHCWRCDSPLIYMARESWFAATSGLKDELMRTNAEIGWNPPETGSGRFGEWLANNVDWALSRDRYWGTPLPVWLCDRDDRHVEWIGGLDALAERAGPLPDGFDPHRPFIDEVTWDCRHCDGTMRRTPEVIDVWFDSGAMPYAQWHYPFENQDEFARHFPADFIAEGIDQTRGWFYSLLAISTMLGMGTAFRNVVVNGFILDANGLKMSKSRGNMVDPWDAIGQFGADGIRWHMMTVSSPGSDKRYDPDAFDVTRKFFDTLFNTYKFFALYARTEAWEPGEDDPAPAERPLMDRWILGRLQQVVERTGAAFDAYQATRGCRAVQDFLVEDVSNWYVRRSRPRFWNNDDERDARAAFRTLHDVLRTVSMLMAPVAPFAADWLHTALTGESAHLTRFPESESDAATLDSALFQEMADVRALVSLGRAAREEVGIRVRQPVSRVQVVTPSGALRPELLALVHDELNVKRIDFMATSEGLVRLVARPNYRSLGQRFRQKTEVAAQAIRALDQRALRAFQDQGAASIVVDGESHDLGPDDLDVLAEAEGDLSLQAGQGYTVALDSALTPELIREGLAREVVNRIQRLRRDAGLDITDRIDLHVSGHDDVLAAVADHRGFVLGETLALGVDTTQEPAGFPHVKDVELDGRAARIGLRRSRVPLQKS